MVDLNDRFIFIGGSGFNDMAEERSAHYIFVLNRHDNNNPFTRFKSDFGQWVIYKNQICCITWGFIQIYEIDGLVQREPIKTVYRIECMYPTFNFKHI